MATDAALLAELDASMEPRTIVRFYSWVRPTLSVGRNQPLETVADVEFCRSAGIDIVRRPTGGGAVLHDDEITYAMVSNEPDAFGDGSVYGTYRRVSEALAEGYRRLGVDVALAPAPSSAGRGSQSPSDQSPCFVSQSRYELSVDGRKILGSAQRRLRRAFLQHGSMPIVLDRGMLAGATRFGDPAPLFGRMTSLSECLSRVPGRGTLIRTFAEALGDTFGVVLDVAGEDPGARRHTGR